MSLAVFKEIWSRSQEPNGNGNNCKLFGSCVDNNFLGGQKFPSISNKQLGDTFASVSVNFLQQNYLG